MNRPVSLTTLNELFNYNYWARDRQLKVCVALTEDQFKRPLGSSFSSVRDTLVHMVAVERLWLERWRGQTPQSLLRPEEFPTLPAVQKYWHEVEREMREYLSNLNEKVIEQPITYVNTRGQTWTYALWRMMLHLLNHQSYHRGQVTTLLRQLEIQPTQVDFLVANDSGFK